MIFLRNESLRSGSGGAELTEGLILDLDFNGNYTDKSHAGLVLTGGNSEGTNPPTFIPGRKAGTFCASFNGSQSLRTTSNLSLNSDKVTVSFWMKTVQTSVASMFQLSEAYHITNSFACFINDLRKNKIELGSGTSVKRRFVDSATDINNASWVRFVGVIDRSTSETLVKIYINGVDVTSPTSLYSNNYGVFNPYPFFIGQENGDRYGFIGQLQDLKVYNRAFTAEQALTDYNSQL